MFAERSLLFTQWASHMGPGTKEEPDRCSCAVWNHRFLTPSLTAPQPQHDEIPALHPKSPVQDKGCWGHCRSWVSWCPEFRIHSRPCSARRGSQMSWYSLDSLQGGEAGKPCRSAAQPGQILPNLALQYRGELSRGPSHPGSEGQVPSLPFLSFSSLHLVCPSFTSPLTEKCDPATLVLPVSPLQNKMRHSFLKVLSLLLLPLLLEGEFSKAKDLCLSPSRLYPTPRTVS